jgi:Protein of unknown function (DUF1566)
VIGIHFGHVRQVSLLLAALGLGACRAGKPSPIGTTEPAVDDAAMPADAASAASAHEASAERAVASVEAWASWPMPNSPSSRLPNPQTYDTSIEGVAVDGVTGLMWQRSAFTDGATFEEAKRECDQLTLAGFAGWRLPSRIELLSIVDLSRTQPSINLAAFRKTPSDWFWTSSVASDNPAAAWYVYFYFGYPKTDDKTNRFAVRCVRTAAPRATPRAAPSAPAAPRYDARGLDVRDTATGLTWQREVPTRAFAFEGARAYCAQLTLGGKTGWRVPSMGELLTLIDEHASAPMIDTAAFPATPRESFWTSSVFADTPAMAWHVYFDHGNALYGLVSGAHRVRCVL